MEIAQERVDALAKVGVAIPFQSAKFMEELDYNSLLITSTESFKIEQARIAEERRKDAERIEAENKVRAEEAKRLAAERAELEKARAEEAKKKQEQEAILRAEREKVEAERRELEKWRIETEHKAAVERAKKDAAEKAVREAQEKAEREAKEKAEAEQRAKEEAELQERLRPDKEKLIAYANSLLVDIELQTEPAKAILMEAYNRLTKVKTFIIKAAKEL